jgi:hypothetical protein
MFAPPLAAFDTSLLSSAPLSPPTQLTNSSASNNDSPGSPLPALKTVSQAAALTDNISYQLIPLDDSDSEVPDGAVDEGLDQDDLDGERGVALLLDDATTHGTHSLCGRAPHKSLTYASLITMAILSMPGRRAQIHDIYRFISAQREVLDGGLPVNFKLSIRHNLSSRKCFIRTNNPGCKRNSWWSVDLTQLPYAARLAASRLLHHEQHAKSQ